ncbi:MAG: PEP-CTERM sorting domain-containing protein [Planctomycetota bacterium]
MTIDPKPLATAVGTLALALAAAPPVSAQTFIEDGGTTTIESMINEFIGVFDGPGDQPTTVVFESPANITGLDPDDDSVFVVDNSIVIINGGNFVGNITAFDDATLTINGGVINDDVIGFGSNTGSNTLVVTGGSIGDDLEIYSDGTLTVTGGSVGEDLEAFEDSFLSFSGGTVANNFTVYDDATALVTGGFIDNDLEAINNAAITVRGGSIAEDTEASGSATIDIFGGTLGTSIASGGNSVITLYGPGFQINGQSAGFGEIAPTFGLLSGTLSDGTAFSVDFARITEGFFFRRTGDIVLVEQAVPEPTSLALLVLGSAALLRRQRNASASDPHPVGEHLYRSWAHAGHLPIGTNPPC